MCRTYGGWGKTAEEVRVDVVAPVVARTRSRGSASLKPLPSGGGAPPTPTARPRPTRSRPRRGPRPRSQRPRRVLYAARPRSKIVAFVFEPIERTLPFLPVRSRAPVASGVIPLPHVVCWRFLTSGRDRGVEPARRLRSGRPPAHASRPLDPPPLRRRDRGGGAQRATRPREGAVLEQRDRVGGAAITDQPWGPDFKVTTLSYVVEPHAASTILPAPGFELERHGYKVYPQHGYFAPHPDGRSLLLRADPALRRAEIARFSARDADAMERWDAWLGRPREDPRP